MSRQHDEATVPSITLPPSDARERGDSSEIRLRREVRRGPEAPAPRLEHLSAAPSDGPPAPQEPVRRTRSFAYSGPPRAIRPLQAGGAPPTVIKNLDAMFAADRARRSTPAPSVVPYPIAPPPIPLEPAALAQALLDKVSRDFGSYAPPPPASVLEARALHELPTGEHGLPADDAEAAALLPWYARLFRRLFR